MFGVFLKARLEIEARINNLQKFYIEILKSSILPISRNKENDLDKATEILQEKLKVIENIKEEYTKALLQYEDTSKILLEAKALSEDIENQLDQLFELFGLEIPEDLIREEHPQTQVPVTETEKVETEEEDFDADKENSQVCEEEEDIVSSDKKTFKKLESSDEYFSPDIQIRKSIKKDNEDWYTPASKSHSKSSSRKF